MAIVAVAQEGTGVPGAIFARSANPELEALTVVARPVNSGPVASFARPVNSGPVASTGLGRGHRSHRPGRNGALTTGQAAQGVGISNAQGFFLRVCPLFHSQLTLILWQRRDFPEPTGLPVVPRSVNADFVAITGLPRALTTGHTAQGGWYIQLLGGWYIQLLGRGLRGHPYGFARCATVS